jgi:hypothetical protein
LYIQLYMQVIEQEVLETRQRMRDQKILMYVC